MATPPGNEPQVAAPGSDLFRSHADEGAPRPPERYGKYNLLQRVGLGGMAEVWQAKTLGTEGFTKDLVIKRILPRLSGDPEFVRAFIEEARLVARLQHANVVQIFDFDKEGDTYYLAMELVDGRDLRQIERAAVKAGLWPTVPMAVYLIAEACKGLHYVHTKVEHGKPLSLVHRDISPHNLLVSRSGDVKISDFGIAKVAKGASRTQIGMVKGKLSYMSPEQISGKPLDARSDLYAMGVVLWELLTRGRLFHGPEVEVVRRVRDGDVPPPRSRNPDVPEDVERIVMKLLLADREARYQSAGDVVRDLCALPCYAYEAQALGDLVRRLFPEETKNWTQMLSAMADEPAPDRIKGKGNMAGSDQKTQMAELPPEVAARLANRAPEPVPAPAPHPAAPPAAPAMQRTVMAEAPVVARAPEAAAARTVMAQAPNLPVAGPPVAGPPVAGPPAAGYIPPPVAPGGFAQGLPPPNWNPAGGAGAPAASARPAAPPMNPQATVMTGPGTGSGPPGGSARPLPGPGPLQLRPASAVFGVGETAASGGSALTRFIAGPVLMILLALITLLLSNRLQPPETGSGGAPPIFAARNRVQLVTTPPGATVLVDGVALADKTPTFVQGDIGKKARVRITLNGFQAYEATIPFTKDQRPPLRINLLRKGQALGKEQDPSAYDDHPGTKTTPDPEEEGEEEKGEQKGEQKAVEPALVGKQEKAEKRPERAEKKPEAVAAVEQQKGEEGAPGEEPGEEGRKGKKHRSGEKASPKGKGLLQVTVRPWAIVYVDNRKVKQTPLRDFLVSPGKHTVLLVNDNKGKRESITINAVAGEITSLQRNWE